jgi:hypothetical protein
VGEEDFGKYYQCIDFKWKTGPQRVRPCFFFSITVPRGVLSTFLLHGFFIEPFAGVSAHRTRANGEIIAAPSLMVMRKKLNGFFLHTLRVVTAQGAGFFLHHDEASWLDGRHGKSPFFVWGDVNDMRRTGGFFKGIDFRSVCSSFKGKGQADAPCVLDRR